MSSRMSSVDFNPRSSCEERLKTSDIERIIKDISIHAPHARSDQKGHPIEGQPIISIHAPHARSDLHLACLLRLVAQISIHAPHARSDIAVVEEQRAAVISIHAPHARSDVHKQRRVILTRHISIHAPHARSDPGQVRLSDAYGQISIHAPHARSDHHRLSTCPLRQQFQSTLLMRGATRRACRTARSSSHFNPRSSCEERRP